MFLTILGFFSILTALLVNIRITFASFILNNALLLFLFGLCLFVCGLALIIHTLLSCKRKYTIIRTGKNEVTVSEILIQEYLNAYWQKLFPGKSVSSHIIVKKHTIKIIADLPAIPYEDQKHILERIERDIQDLFRDTLGYREEIELAVSFQNTDG